ncbi:hypothetical protein KXX10_005838 [Aspergillus fumigatus]|nr:hypothetical protein KXX10_005838 [Aspergillus fumigatus]
MSEDLDSLAMSKRRLLCGEITYAAAKEQDANILHQLGYRDQKIRYFTHLYRSRKQIESIVAHHLGLRSADTCRMVEVENWIHGSFNVCIRVDVDGQRGDPGKQVMIRFPLPYRIGEDSCPGNADEKFTVLDNLPFITRVIQRLRRRLLKWLNYHSPSPYVQHQTNDKIVLGTPYLLIEYIDPSRGKMLSETWEEGRHDIRLRTNLFHGLSHIMLALARIPLPKIGSFTLDEKGYLSLNNRPLTLEIHQLENEHIPLDMPRNATYATVDSYVNDILAFHESRLRHQPNAVNDVEDGFYQTSALMVMRSVWSCFFRRDFLRGPFFLNLTDLNQSNIFVDNDWNIKCLIDLEWACSHPVEMIQPPHWLTNQAVDLISIDDYDILRKEFMTALAEEEMKIEPPVRLYPILQDGWDRGTFWCSLALSSPTALFKIFYDFIQQRFSRDHDDPAFWKITMPYWTFNTFGFIENKVKDKEQYDISLRKAFEIGDPHN